MPVVENSVSLTLRSPEGWQPAVCLRLVFNPHPPGLKVWKGPALVAGARLSANLPSHLNAYLCNQVFTSTGLGRGC